MFIKSKKTNRNTTCPCGSGQKFKNCCIDNTQRQILGGVFTDSLWNLEPEVLGNVFKVRLITTPNNRPYQINLDGYGEGDLLKMWEFFDEVHSNLNQLSENLLKFKFNESTLKKKISELLDYLTHNLTHEERKEKFYLMMYYVYVMDYMGYSNSHNLHTVEVKYKQMVRMVA